MDLSSAYSKRLDLADALVRAVSQLRGAQQGAETPRASVRSAGRSEREWRVSDRLSDNGIEASIAAFKTGTAKWKLAESYGISESSVKRVIRRHRAIDQMPRG